MNEKIKQIYMDNLLNCNDIIEMKNDCINDDDFYDCLVDNLHDLFNDNIDCIVRDILLMMNNS